MTNTKLGLIFTLAAATALSVGDVAAQQRAPDAPAVAAIKSIQRVSTNAAGSQIAVGATIARITSDGTKVGFLSRGTNLGGDANAAGYNHLYVKDLATGKVTRVDSTATGTAGNSSVDSLWNFSPDGTRVVFSSGASNLVGNDTNYANDVFEKTLANGAIRRLSVVSTGAQANGASYQPVYSRDRTKIAFSSYATNFVAGDTNGASDVFVKSLATGAVTRVSVAPSGQQGNYYSGYPSFSPREDRIAFISYATNLGPPDDASSLSIFDRSLGATNDMMMINIRADGKQALYQSNWSPVWAPSGNAVLFVTIEDGVVKADNNHVLDIYQRVVPTKVTVLLSRSNAGGTLNSHSSDPAYDGSGTIFAFSTMASNIANDDSNGVFDVYLRDSVKKTTVRISTRADGTQALNGGSRWPSLSKDGKKIVFTSTATNLVAGDTNGSEDVFLVTMP